MRTPPRILIVEDNPAGLEILQMRLEAHNYEIITATDGEAGLTMAKNNQPDLILLDIMMPGMTGLEVCRHLKSAVHSASVPVIFMTALSDLEDKMAAFEAGGIDYVTKPFQVEELLARVDTHVRLRRTGRELMEQNRRLQK